MQGKEYSLSIFKNGAKIGKVLQKTKTSKKKSSQFGVVFNYAAVKGKHFACTKREFCL
jgi:hypothetical protein